MLRVERFISGQMHEATFHFKCMHESRQLCRGCWGKIQDFNASLMAKTVTCPICKAELNYTNNEPFEFFGDNDIEAIERLNRHHKKVWAAIIGSLIVILGVGSYLLYLLSKSLD